MKSPTVRCDNCGQMTPIKWKSRKSVDLQCLFCECVTLNHRLLDQALTERLASDAERSKAKGPSDLQEGVAKIAGGSMQFVRSFFDVYVKTMMTLGTVIAVCLFIWVIFHGSASTYRSKRSADWFIEIVGMSIGFLLIAAGMIGAVAYLFWLGSLVVQQESVPRPAVRLPRKSTDTARYVSSIRTTYLLADFDISSPIFTATIGNCKGNPNHVLASVFPSRPYRLRNRRLRVRPTPSALS